MTSGELPRKITVPKVEMVPDSHDLVHRRSKNWIVALGMLGALGLAILVVRGVQLTVYPTDETNKWFDIWRGNTDEDDTVDLRGRILDRNNHVLAMSENRGRLTFSPRFLNSKKKSKKKSKGNDVNTQTRAGYAAEMARKFAPFVAMPEKEMREILENGSSDRLIDGSLSPSALRRIKDIVKAESTKYNNAYAKIEHTHRRKYPEAIAPQVLGFVNSKARGMEGLEAYYNADLSGIKSRRSHVNKKLRSASQLHALSEPGNDIQTTLDVHLQWYVEQELAQIQEVSEPEWATAVLVEVKTGKILAMANTPTYDANGNKDNPAARRNHALKSFPEPGSIVKPVGMAIALDKAVVSAEQTIDCEGGRYLIGRQPIHDDHPEDVIPLGGVIKYSSNIGSAKVAAKVGAGPFIQGFREFGFSRQTTYPEKWVQKGVLRNPAKIRPIELATTAFGQGMTASPLEVVMAIGALANQGVLMEPQIVSGVKNAEGEFTKQILPKVVRRVVSPEAAREVTQMMVSVMEPEGTGAAFAVEGLSIAGKTGTAQVVDPETRAYGRDRTASFVGFAPAEDPEVAVIVMAYRPQKGLRYGGTVTGQAFANILKESVRYLGAGSAMENDLTDGASQSAHIQTPRESVHVAETPEGLVLPDFAGLAVREALAIASKYGLQVEVGGSGYVQAQTPTPGAVVARGSTISIELH